MIQIYSKENTGYSKNGDTVLFPISCRLLAKLNSTWEMKLVHPIDAEGRWKHIEEEAVICAPTFMGERQLFRIDKVDKTDTEITATAYPVFFDSADDCFLMDTRPESKNGQQALGIMTTGTKYSGESDIATASTAYFVRRNLMDCINGKDEPTFIQRWGGEILYDNYKVIINKRAGGDYGVEVRYGKNMDGLNYSLDMSEVITRIIPVAYNGRMLSGSSPWVDSPNINKYTKKYIREMKFDNVRLREDMENAEEDGLIICGTLDALRKELIKQCKEQYAAGVDIPRITIELNMVDLSRTEEYKEYSILEKVGLGDTVHCRHSILDITTDARVIELEWDCIRNIPSNMKLGEFEYDYFSALTSTMDSFSSTLDSFAPTLNSVKNILGPGDTVMAEKVRGVLNAINTQLKYQKNIAQKQDVRAILFEDLDPASPTYGAMALGTQGFQISNKRTQDGRDWEWSTAFTAKGGYADVLIAGLLADKTGRSFWNLDTGEIQLTGTLRQYASNGNKSVDIQGNQVKIYDWEENGEYVGSVGATRVRSEGKGGISLWCEDGKFVTIGRKNPDTGKIDNIIHFDDSTPEKPPYIVNTVSGVLFGDLEGGGIEVQNGLIKNWSMKGVVSGTIRLGEVGGGSAEVDVTHGLITGWRYING